MRPRPLDYAGPPLHPPTRPFLRPERWVPAFSVLVTTGVMVLLIWLLGPVASG